MGPVSNPSNGRRFMFGVYPGGAAGAGDGGMAVGPPDVPERMMTALAALQGDPARPLLVRAYEVFADDNAGAARRQTPADPGRYVNAGRRLDLVAQFQSPSGDVDGYCRFVGNLLGHYRESLATVQVGEEPNVVDNPVLDGAYPDILDAVVAGVRTAREHARRLGLDGLQVGINTTPLFGPSERFLADLAAVGGPSFVGALDYLGLDFFPDVFRPIPLDRLEGVVEGLLRQHREQRMTPAGMGHLPLRITEHGWPTGSDRPPERQAQVLATVVRAVAANRDGLHLDGYSHFALRDADSSQPGLFHRFGLMTDDYQPKAAFHAYRQLIAELAH